jgi:pimeloyl-ACP methyl ester carboxylesterase
VSLPRQLAAHSARRTTVAGLAALATGPGEGPPVLLLPGFTGSKEDFAPILDDLAAAGFPAVTVDLPGQFESPGPDDPGRYTPTALVDLLLPVVGELGGRVHVVGHSFGGLVARAMVLAAPGRFASLTLMSSGPAAIGGARRAALDLLEPVLPAVGLARLYEHTLQLARSDPSYQEPTPALAEFLRQRFLAGSTAMLLGMGLALRTEPDRTEALARVPLPKLVVYGDADDAWPPSVQADMAERLAAERVVNADAAHSPAAENPQPTVEALTSFWRRCADYSSSSVASPSQG